MRFESFIEQVGEVPYFDLAMAVQIAGEKKAKLQTQLSRWTRAGKLLPLRRGMYALAAPYRRAPVNPAELAYHLYRPSYLSCEWALAFHGLIPEKAVTYTSVTTRVPRRFENHFGVFAYRNVKRDSFFGYRATIIQGSKVMLADPEKALLDLWHLNPGLWTLERMTEMRFQNQGIVDADRLMEYATRFDSPRLMRAAKTWMELRPEESEGTVEL